MIPAPGRRRARALAVLLGVLAVWGVVAAPAAAAHAYVLTTVPANGAEVPSAPTRIVVTFDEPVTMPSATGVASVIDSDGNHVDDGSAQLRDGGRTLVVGVRSGVPKGAYIASWSVVSADSHPVGGSIQFGYGVPAVSAAVPPAPEPSTGLQLLVGLVKGLLYLGLVVALGLVPAASVLDAEPGERRLLRRAARVGVGLAILASALQVGTQYLWDASALAGGPTWRGLREFAGSAYPVAVAVRVVLLAAIAVVLPRAASTGRAAAIRWAATVVLGLAVLVTVVENGHGGAGEWWRSAVTVVHAGAVVAWLGGLAVLGWLVLRRRLPVRRLRRLPRWSAYAGACVGLLVGTGLVQALVQVGYPAALVDTTYGATLLVKLALVAAVLALALRGRSWIRRELVQTAGDPGAGLVTPGRTALLRRRVRTEAGLGALVVVVSGVLSSTPPAVTAYAPTRVVHATIGPYAVTIQVAPARRGPQSFRVTAEGATAGTPPARSIQLDLGQETGSVQALPVTFPYRLPGAIAPDRPTPLTFVSSAVDVPTTGPWTGTLTVVAGETAQYTDAFTYDVV